MEGDYVARRAAPTGDSWDIVARVALASDASITVEWQSGGEQELRLPLPADLRVWRQDAVHVRAVTEPDSLTAEFRADPSGMLVRLLAEAGPTLKRAQLRKLATELGLAKDESAYTTAWWTKQWAALLERSEVTVAAGDKYGLTWSSNSRHADDEVTASRDETAVVVAAPPERVQAEAPGKKPDAELAKKIRLLEAEVAATRAARDKRVLEAVEEASRAETRAAGLASQLAEAVEELQCLRRQVEKERGATAETRSQLTAATARADSLEAERDALRETTWRGEQGALLQARIDVARVLCAVLSDIARDAAAAIGEKADALTALLDRTVARAAQAGVVPVAAAGTSGLFDPEVHEGPAPGSGNVRVEFPGFAMRGEDGQLYVLSFAGVRELTQ